jgi:hypothetical protein
MDHWLRQVRISYYYVHPDLPKPLTFDDQGKGGRSTLHQYGSSLTVLVQSHHTPQAILLGLEGRPLSSCSMHTLTHPVPVGSDPETIDTGTIPSRYTAIQTNKTLLLGGRHHISYDMDRDMLWRWDQVLKTHPNGLRFSVFDENGDLLATNEYFR